MGFPIDPSTVCYSAPQLASDFFQESPSPSRRGSERCGMFFYVKRMVKNQSLLGGGFNFFLFSSLPNWEMIQFDKHIFQRGWNHQLVWVSCKAQVVSLQCYPTGLIYLHLKKTSILIPGVSYLGSNLSHLSLVLVTEQTPGFHRRVGTLFGHSWIALDFFWLWAHMGRSKNRGTPKWMVYNGNPY